MITIGLYFCLFGFVLAVAWLLWSR